MACIMTINVPSVLPAALRVGGMVFAHSLPSQAMPGDFFRQYPLSPCLVHVRIEQGKRVDSKAFHPPTVDLHLADIERLPGCQGIPDQPFSLFPHGRIVRFPGHIDGQGVVPGFLPGNGLDQGGRRFLRLRAAERHEQGNRKSQKHCFHGVDPSGFRVEPKANKRAPQGRTCGGTPEWWAYRACPVLRVKDSITR